MENAFPFLCLPNPDQQRVLRCLRYIDQLCLSILSKKTKSLLHSLEIKILSTTLRIDDPIELTISFSYDYRRFQLLLNYDGDVKSVENAPDRASLVDRWPHVDQDRTTLRSQLTLRDWIRHIFHVYHGSQIERLEFSDESFVYDLPSIKTALRVIEAPFLEFEQLINEELFKRITTTFFKAKKLSIRDTYRPENTDYLKQILASNLDLFDVAAQQFPYFSSLDNLLSINSSTILIEHSTMTDKDLNRFLKLRIKGAMPRLKLLYMTFVTDERGQVWNEDFILNGIQYTEMREGEERSGVFEWFHGPQPQTVFNGLNILRCDGVNATIQLEHHNGNTVGFDFYVWE